MKFKPNKDLIKWVEFALHNEQTPLRPFLYATGSPDGGIFVHLDNESDDCTTTDGGDYASYEVEGTYRTKFDLDLNPMNESSRRKLEEINEWLQQFNRNEVIENSEEVK